MISVNGSSGFARGKNEHAIPVELSVNLEMDLAKWKRISCVADNL